MVFNKKEQAVYSMCVRAGMSYCLKADIVGHDLVGIGRKGYYTVIDFVDKLPFTPKEVQPSIKQYFVVDESIFEEFKNTVTLERNQGLAIIRDYKKKYVADIIQLVTSRTTEKVDFKLLYKLHEHTVKYVWTCEKRTKYLRITK